MSTEAEMKRVLAHVAAQMARAVTIVQGQTYVDRELLTSVAYAKGVLDLLGTYLAVTDSPAASADRFRQELVAAVGRDLGVVGAVPADDELLAEVTALVRLARTEQLRPEAEDGAR